MTRKAITSSHAVLSCDVCGRTLLRGERADPFITGGVRRLVCELCTARATNEGWIREGADDVAVRRAGAGGRRSLLGRLRRSHASEEPERSRRARRVAEPAEEQPVWAEEPEWHAEPPPPAEAPPTGAPQRATAAPPPAAAAPPPAATPSPAAAWTEPEPAWHDRAGAPPAAEAPPPATPEGGQSNGAGFPAPAWPGEERPREQGEPPDEEAPGARRDVHAVPTNASLKVARALELFNVSPHPRTVGGVARSLGAPLVTARPSVTEGSIVTIVVAWELCWYRYEVDLADEAAGVRVVEQGAELEELPPEDQSPNAAADDRGALVPA